ncbi:hypothetical protein [Halorarius litoreus]|uniref:hypothetical protein n=1 Tax=Halorarius litoreus TaxID=2962676 RepID=UPI0020CC824F|nr:hypothetical protein [Halorarius litoreus]
MRRRSLLATLPAAAALGGCSSLSSLTAPDLRPESGSGVLQPADELQIAHGLQPDGDDGVYAIVAPDEARDLVTEDTDDHLVDTLSNDGGDVFTLVLQMRSTPDAPISLMLEPGGDVRVERNTLHADVVVEPWGSLDRIDHRETRESLRSADELVYTSVWNLTPELRSLPEQVDLHLYHRG